MSSWSPAELYTRPQVVAGELAQAERANQARRADARGGRPNPADAHRRMCRRLRRDTITRHIFPVQRLGATRESQAAADAEQVL